MGAEGRGRSLGLRVTILRKGNDRCGGEDGNGRKKLKVHRQSPLLGGKSRLIPDASLWHGDLVVSRRRYVGMIATTSIYPVGSSQNVCRRPTFGFAGKIQESGRRADASCRRPAHDKCHEF